MKEWRATAVVLLAGLALTVAFTLVPPEATLGTPTTPASDAVVLEQVARRVRPAAPATEAEAAARARELVLEARARGGDPRLLGQAQAVLSRWWSEPAPSPEVLLMRATLKQSLHDFEGSLADLEVLARLRPDDAQAWLTRATVLTVLARYDEALTACGRLPPEPAPGRAVCEATPRALSGHLGEARQALAALERDAWALSVRGELERWSGDDAAAEASLRAALRLDPNDGYTRLLLAELLLDVQRAGEVAPLFAGRALNDAELLMVVLAAHGEQESAELAARVAANRQRGETLHRREESRYALRVEGDAPRALALAQENWKVQREPADARVLLEAAVAAKRPDAAAPALEWLRATQLPWPALQALAKEAR